MTGHNEMVTCTGRCDIQQPELFVSVHFFFEISARGVFGRGDAGPQLDGGRAGICPQHADTVLLSLGCRCHTGQNRDREFEPLRSVHSDDLHSLVIGLGQHWFVDP